MSRKLTYKNNIVKRTASKTSYAIVNNRGAEIDSNLTLEDAKYTVDFVNENR